MKEIARLKAEVRKLLEELRKRGVPEKEILSLFVKRKEPSRLLITSDHKIILLDYGDGIEIKIPPLPKSVYFLFLRHPEGIAFKDLPDYTDELREIYREMKRGTEVPKKVERSIIEVTNPLSHSIIEKCARISLAFREKVGIGVARYYVISGKRGETRKIMLDRKLVGCEKESPPL